MLQDSGRSVSKGEEVRPELGGLRSQCFVH